MEDPNKSTEIKVNSIDFKTNIIEVEDWTAHLSPFTRRIIDIHDLDNIMKINANHGVCGSHKLCKYEMEYLNSFIACLSNCLELTVYFLAGNYKRFFNQIKKKNELSNAWYDILMNYWTTDIKVGKPSSLKSIIEKKISKIDIKKDVNRFITEFLWLLNEDLNKNDQKINIEIKEKGNEESELDCALRFWNLYLKNNDSIIEDLFFVYLN